MDEKEAMQAKPGQDAKRAGEGRNLAMMAAVFALLMLAGTFCDETLARTLYTPGNVPATLITTLGIYPFTGAAVLFLGVACERVARADRSTISKLVSGGVFVAVALFAGFMGSRSLLDADCLGGIFPGLDKNYAAIGGVFLVCMCPLFYVGWRLATRNDDPGLQKQAVCFVLVLLGAFAFMQLSKGIFNRPRFRSVALGLEGVNFVPWYHISPKPDALMAQYGLAANEFRSFPSGHAILSTCSIAVLLAFTKLVPSLRGKETTLCWAGFGFAVVIMFTRMLLGAHYLSDVSAGALIGLLFVWTSIVVRRKLDGAAA